MTDAEIEALFEKREKEAGGWAYADQKAILRQVAEETGETYARVRAVMLNAWGAGASG